MSMDPQVPTARAVEGEWPPADLEHLGRCPACGGEPGTTRFAGLEDKAFRVAPGRWTLLDCGACGAAYLDPRPTPASMGRAYAQYYTHGEFVVDESHFFWCQRDWRSRLKTAYLNSSFGYRFPNALPFGAAVVRRRPDVQLSIDYSIRHLPAPTGPDAALLDVGCGNGLFVAIARSLGFRAIGLDPDAKAVEAGRRNGLDIREGLLPDESLRERGLEHVTMSHVLEHLHSPREAVAQCHDMLKPGGRIWISQPNLAAIGLQTFGENWRGLEAPRHLSLYDFDSLSRLLAAAGFEDISLLPAEEAALFYFRQSDAMRRGLDPYAAGEPDPAVDAAAAAANERARLDPGLSESLTVTARRR
jgi:SAM-dependent methyltransferase